MKVKCNSYTYYAGTLRNECQLKTSTKCSDPATPADSPVDSCSKVAASATPLPGLPRLSGVPGVLATVEPLFMAVNPAYPGGTYSTTFTSHSVLTIYPRKLWP